MPESFANRYQTTLNGSVTAGALTGVVTTATGIPTAPFRAIISAEGSNTDEIVLVTVVSSTTLTWVRAAEAVAGVRTASAHASGAIFTAIVTAQGIAQPVWQQRNVAQLTMVDAIMGTPPVVGAIATSTAIGSPLTWASLTDPGGNGSFVLNSSLFGYRAGAGITEFGATYPNYNYVQSLSLTDPVISNQNYFCVDFYFDGTLLEVLIKGMTQWLRVRVNGELVSGTPITVAANGNTDFLPITFASRAVRRISIEGLLTFGGVVTGPNDSIWAADIPGPRVIVLGDSISDGSGSPTGWVSTWVRKMCQAMGWYDVGTAAVGGTGFMNPGSGGRVKFRDRLQADIIAFAPDIVIYQGSINDIPTYTAAQIAAELTACILQVRTALPNTLQVWIDLMWRKGVETYTNALMDTHDAMRTAAIAGGALVVDLIEDVLPVAISGTLSSTATAGATAVLSNTKFPARGTVEIGTGSTRERRWITSVSGAGPYTHNFSGVLANTQTSGNAIKAVGNSFWTGTGQVGTTTGSGNSDLLVASDATHPTDAGHAEIGMFVARRLAAQLAR